MTAAQLNLILSLGYKEQWERALEENQRLSNRLATFKAELKDLVLAVQELDQCRLASSIYEQTKVVVASARRIINE
jgi:hypothetical protein